MDCIVPVLDDGLIVVVQQDGHDSQLIFGDVHCVSDFQTDDILAGVLYSACMCMYYQVPTCKKCITLSRKLYVSSIFGSVC